jgi:hypothetical protein
MAAMVPARARPRVYTAAVRLNRLISALAAASLLASCGCYRRVVESKGIGADRYPVQEPYAHESEAEDFLMGPRTGPKKKIVRSYWIDR